MQRVLVFNRFYLPGYQAGGPIVSLANMISVLGDEISFSVITSDRDINDSAPYPQIAQNTWLRQDNASVRYLCGAQTSIEQVADLIRASAPDVVYLNSFFDTWFSYTVLAARWLGKLPPCRLVLAPRGEFSAGALSIKPFRKRAYIEALRGLGLLKAVEWHASTDVEAAELRLALALRSRAKIHVAADLGSLPARDIASRWMPRPSDAPLRLCFLSRISPIKNLLGAINMLSHMRAPAHLDIFGPKEDQKYWAECEQAAARLPSHVTAIYRGAVAPPSIHATLAKYDAMLFPTFGENYGHVIPEALSVGLPVVTSDRTPWKDLAARGIGYDGELDEVAFARQLDELAALSVERMRAMRDRAEQFARGVLADPDKIEANRRLFVG